MSIAEPTLLREPPRFSRDLTVHAWIAVKALSDAGDAIWTIALAWTALAEHQSHRLARFSISSGPE